MRESLTYGSVRGAPGNGRPYRDPDTLLAPICFLTHGVSLEIVGGVKKNLDCGVAKMFFVAR